MDPKFQTSFIPKKQSFASGGGFASQKVPRHMTSVFMLIAVVMFLASLGGVAGAYFYQQYLLKTQSDLKTQLAGHEKQFNMDLIEQLKQINVQIDIAKELIEKHIAFSQIFDIVGKMTVSNTRFISMDVSSPTIENGNASLSLKGYGSNLAAVAFQSDVLGQLSQYNISSKTIINPIVSDPVLDANGTVSFGFSASVDPKSLSYTHSVTGTNEVASTTEQ